MLHGNGVKCIFEQVKPGHPAQAASTDLGQDFVIGQYCAVVQQNGFYESILR